MAFCMPANFSQQLNNQLIDYFKRKYAIDITSEQADDYLDSLADLVTAFESKQKNSLRQSRLTNNTPKIRGA